MATPDDKHSENIDALQALAAGQDAAPSPRAEGETPPGSSSGLMLLSEDEDAKPQTPSEADLPANPLLDDTAADAAPALDGEPAPDGTDALNDLAAVSGAVSGSVPEELAAAAGGDSQESPELGDIAAASNAVAPTVRPQERAMRLQAGTRRVHSQAYKQTMIPLLLVVGLMLIGFSVLTMIMLVGGREDDPDSIAGEMTYMQAYGKYFILASLPLGAILLMGAWLFFIDVKRSGSRGRR